MKPSSPDILVILCDQLRAQSVPPYNTQVHLPAMQAMINEGVRMDNALSTYPLCTPFRGMFMTGRHPQSTGIFLNFTSSRYGEIGLGDVFARAGYRTGYVGKWHLNRGAFPSETLDFIPEGRARLGFDYWRAYNCHIDFWDGNINGDDWNAIQWEGYETHGLMHYAREFWNAPGEESQSRFMVVAPHQPHWNWADVCAPEDCYARVPERLEPPANVPESYHERMEEQMRHYMAMTVAVDDMIAELREMAGPETLILFTSDHGTLMGAHNQPGEDNAWGKSRAVEEAIRVPLLAVWPGRIPAGTTRDELFIPVDFMPTLCGFAGLPIPRTAEGLNLSAAFLGGAPAETRDAAFLMNFLNYAGSPNYFLSDGHEWRGLRTKTHTFVEWREGPRELYDLRADPLQEHNAVDHPENAELVRELSRRLHEEMARRGETRIPATHEFRPWIDAERRIVRNAFGPLPHPDEAPDWSLLGG